MDAHEDTPVFKFCLSLIPAVAAVGQVPKRAAATEEALAAEQAADKASTERAFTRRKPVRKPFPAHLPRERVVVEVPTSCTCCGSDRIIKTGGDISETLEVIPLQWKVIQTVR